MKAEKSIKTQMNAPVNPTTNKRRKFDATFKQEAVSLWLNSGKSAQQIGEELGLRAELLYKWNKRFAPAPQGGRGAGAKPGAPASALEAENQALRRELERVTQQRDILKKTLGILSETPRSATNGLTP